MRHERSHRLEPRVLGFLVLLVLLQVTNNALPYFGLRDDSCQTMFSGLELTESANNHLFMPNVVWTDLSLYHTDVHVEVTPAPEPLSPPVELVRWLNQPNRALHTEATRAVIHQLCVQGMQVHMRYRDPRRGERDVEDACGDPSLSAPRWWIPVRLFETDYPTTPPAGDE
ncbi:MAG: hypothetical protein AB7S26_32135 [Sandaracinaceae bacterium]